MAVCVYTCIMLSQEQVLGQIPHCSPLNINKRLVVDLDQAKRLVLFTAIHCVREYERGNALYSPYDEGKDVPD